MGQLFPNCDEPPTNATSSLSWFPLCAVASDKLVIDSSRPTTSSGADRDHQTLGSVPHVSHGDSRDIRRELHLMQNLAGAFVEPAEHRTGDSLNRWLPSLRPP